MNEKILIDNIIYLRKDKGYTQKELSELLNYSNKVISKWERGESIPDISAISKIAEVYNVKIDHLIHLDLSSNQSESDDDINATIKQLDIHWIKVPSKFFKSTLLIAVIVYILGVISAFLWFEWVMLISVSIGLALYTIVQQVIVHSVIGETKYKNHEILVKSTITKTYLYIDDILVEKYDSVLGTSFKLSGKIENETIKVNMSRLVTTKCDVFVE